MLNVIALLQHRRNTCEVLQLLDIFQSTCFRTTEKYILYMEPSRKGYQRNITLIQKQVCTRAIIIDGLDTNVDVKNALSEHQQSETCTS